MASAEPASALEADDVARSGPIDQQHGSIANGKFENAPLTVEVSEAASTDHGFREQRQEGVRSHADSGDGEAATEKAEPPAGAGPTEPRLEEGDAHGDTLDAAEASAAEADADAAGTREEGTAQQCTPEVVSANAHQADEDAAVPPRDEGQVQDEPP